MIRGAEACAKRPISIYEGVLPSPTAFVRALPDLSAGVNDETTLKSRRPTRSGK